MVNIFGRKSEKKKPSICSDLAEDSVIVIKDLTKTFGIWLSKCALWKKFNLISNRFRLTRNK